MLIVVSGATGSGKTFLTVKMIAKAYKKGETIHSNIDLSYRRNIRTKTPGCVYRFDYIEDTYHLESTNVLFDDAGKVFNSKRWEDISLEFADKLQTHRHDLLTFYATTPSIKRLYNEFRQLTHKWIRVERVFGFGTEKNNFFSVHRWCELDIDQIEIIEDDKLATPISNYKYFFIWLGSKRLYDTHAQIAHKKYKLQYTKVDGRQIITILPNTMSLKDGMSLWRSLKSGYTQSKQAG